MTMLKNITINTESCEATFDEVSLRSVYDFVKRMGMDRCAELEEFSEDEQKYTMEMMESFDGPRAEITNRGHGCLIEVISVKDNSV